MNEILIICILAFIIIVITSVIIIKKSVKKYIPKHLNAKIKINYTGDFITSTGGDYSE